MPVLKIMFDFLWERNSGNYPKYVHTNTGAPRFMKQVLQDLQRDLDSQTIIVGDFNTQITILDISSRWKINKDFQDLNSALNKGDLIDVYRTLHTPLSQKNKNIHSSHCHISYSKIAHIIRRKTLLK